MSFMNIFHFEIRCTRVSVNEYVQDVIIFLIEKCQLSVTYYDHNEFPLLGESNYDYVSDNCATLISMLIENSLLAL